MRWIRWSHTSTAQSPKIARSAPAIPDLAHLGVLDSLVKLQLRSALRIGVSKNGVLEAERMSNKKPRLRGPPPSPVCVCTNSTPPRATADEAAHGGVDKN